MSLRGRSRARNSIDQSVSLAARSAAWGSPSVSVCSIFKVVSASLRTSRFHAARRC